MVPPWVSVLSLYGVEISDTNYVKLSQSMFVTSFNMEFLKIVML